MKRIIFLFALILSLVSFSFPAFATDINPIPSIDAYANQYRQSYDVIKKAFATNATEDFDTALSQFERDRDKLDNDFFNRRTNDYKNYRKEFIASQSCTNGVSGKKKDCPAAPIICPTNTFIKSGDYTLVGGGGSLLGVTDNRIDWRVRKTGKGRNEATINVKCRYKDSFVAQSVKNDISKIRELIVNTRV